jgi:hypothetical protein
MDALLAVADALVPVLIGLWAGVVIILLWQIERRLQYLVWRFEPRPLELKWPEKWPQPPKPIAPPPPRKRGA